MLFRSPGRAPQVWQRSQPAFRSKVVGPHFESMCRQWARLHAEPDSFDGHVSRVASGTVNDPAARTGHEVDVAVFGRDAAERENLLAIGEAKWNDTMGLDHLRRLEHIRSLLRSRDGIRADRTRLVCFSGAGFTDELRSRAAQDASVQLVDLERLYAGA